MFRKKQKTPKAKPHKKKVTNKKAFCGTEGMNENLENASPVSLMGMGNQMLTRPGLRHYCAIENISNEQRQNNDCVPYQVHHFLQTAMEDHKPMNALPTSIHKKYLEFLRVNMNFC